MTEEERLRAEGERCLRLARQTTATDVAATLSKLASDYLERANALGSSASQPQQSGIQPPAPLAEQARQPEPKEGED
jgi:hypothetical protein